MKKIILPAIAFVSALAFAACSDDDDQSPQPDNPTINTSTPDAPDAPDTPNDSDIPALDSPGFSASERSANDALNQFSYKFIPALAQVYPSSDQPNVSVSPMSAEMVLAMMANSIEPLQSEKITGLIGSDLSTLNTTANKLMRYLNTSLYHEVIKTANSIWHSNAYTLADTYAEYMKSTFYSHIQAVDFADPATTDIINDWAARNTDGLIDPFFETPLSAANIAVMLNAVYINDRWLCPFEKEKTARATFHGINGSAPTDMMNAIDIPGTYFETDTYQYVQIYLDRHNFEIFLPREGVAIDDFCRDFIAEKAKKPQATGKYLLTISMPRFKIESSLDLDNIFELMGLGGISSRFAPMGFDLPGEISPLFVQKTSTELHEEGITAAAVTGGMLAGASPEEPRYATITIDRPFVFILSDCYIGTVNFAGRIAQL